MWPRWIANYVTVAVASYVIANYLMSFLGISTNKIDPFKRKETPTAAEIATPQIVPDAPIMPPSDFHSSSSGSIPSSITLTPQDYVVQSTLTPSLIPTITNTPFPTIAPFSAYIPVGRLVAVGYSYYWPPWGPPNCSEDNWHEKENYCDDTTASGLPWSKYVERAVAVPYEWHEVIPLNSIVRIHSPEIMRGDYLVIDYCGDCIKDEGHIYFDFLSARQILAWTVPMMAEVIQP